jgi:hypothetical protein
VFLFCLSEVPTEKSRDRARPLHEISRQVFRVFWRSENLPACRRQAGRALRSVPFFRLQLPQIVPQDEIDIRGKLPVVLLGKNTELFDHFLIQRKANLNF